MFGIDLSMVVTIVRNRVVGTWFGVWRREIGSVLSVPR